MNQITESKSIPVKGEFDVVVAGAGVAGLAAAVSAKREGCSVLLIEKSCELGGLATLGQINYFVPMCNGHGKQIVKGMCDEFIRLAVKYGYNATPEEWKNGEPEEDTNVRYAVRYSACMFALALNELVHDEGIQLLFDTIVSEPVMENGHCKGLIIENKSGRSFIKSKVVIDTTGDADILYRAGVPTVQGINYHTYLAYTIDLEHCKKAVEAGDIERAIFRKPGGASNLYGKGHPGNVKFYSGTDGDDVSRYLINNQLDLLERMKNDNKAERQIINLPGMCQFRTTRRIDGDYTLRQQDCYKHFEDSISALNDMDHADFLWEIPYRTLVHTGFDNLITAGRSAAGMDYAWDVLRVIPPAIVTGQAAGIAAKISINSKKPIYSIDISELQNKLQEQNVMLHFKDEWIPKPGTGRDIMSISKLGQNGFSSDGVTDSHEMIN